MTTPICFKCIHFKQYQPLTFLKPGECDYRVGIAPPWLRNWLDLDDTYYGPKREIWSHGHIIMAFYYDARTAEELARRGGSVPMEDCDAR